MKRFLTVAVLSALSLPAFSTAAFAHLPPGVYGSFPTGLSHPVSGLDHILAMVAVGLWAGMLGRRATWAVPSAFVTVMLAGFAVALIGVPLPFVEQMILASIIVLGLIVFTAIRLDVRLGMALVGLFAMFHGHAHGGELGEAGALQFATGFAVTTAILHALGIGLGLLTARIGTALGVPNNALARTLGALTAIAGIALSTA